MTFDLEYRLLPVDSLHIHEEVERHRVAELVEEITRRGVVEEPILVARGSNVILNGHHRYAALRSMGARWVPAWVVDYDHPSVGLHRWEEGPPVSKSDVVTRAHAGQPFSPKTTRHILSMPLPHRPTKLSELMSPDRPADGGSAAVPQPRAPSTRPSGHPASD
ncbi:MAG: ParB N-terminal domain-containing protein [Thermoplasmata archaeon]|nr:ParB N-terminal domain-containing protein [Thermoplasmata archaeon]